MKPNRNMLWLGGWLALLTTPAALANNVQFNRGPICSDNGLVATCSAKLTGLGNGDVVITLDVTTEPVAVTTLCKNPKGKLVPGQNPAAIVDIGGVISIPSSQVKNGSLTFSVSTEAPPTPTWSEAGCPNSQWTASLADVVFSGETVALVVSQNGVPVASQTYTFP